MELHFAGKLTVRFELSPSISLLSLKLLVLLSILYFDRIKTGSSLADREQLHSPRSSLCERSAETSIYALCFMAKIPHFELKFE